jgi:hypothetical protein
VTAVASRARRAAATGDAALDGAAAVFTLAVMVHGVDHLRRGIDASGRDVFWLGTLGMFLEVAVVVLVASRHRLAPLAATFGGVALAAGYAAVHFLPARSWLSDPFASARDVNALSWFAGSFEIVAALGLAAAAAVVAQHRRAGALHTAPAPRPLAVAVREPVVVAMAVGNVLLWFAAVVTR